MDIWCPFCQLGLQFNRWFPNTRKQNVQCTLDFTFICGTDISICSSKSIYIYSSLYVEYEEYTNVTWQVEIELAVQWKLCEICANNNMMYIFCYSVYQQNIVGIAINYIFWDEKVQS